MMGVALASATIDGVRIPGMQDVMYEEVEPQAADASALVSSISRLVRRGEAVARAAAGATLHMLEASGHPERRLAHKCELVEALTRWSELDDFAARLLGYQPGSRARRRKTRMAIRRAQCVAANLQLRILLRESAAQDPAAFTTRKGPR